MNIDIDFFYQTKVTKEKLFQSEQAYTQLLPRLATKLAYKDKSSKKTQRNRKIAKPIVILLSLLILWRGIRAYLPGATCPPNLFFDAFSVLFGLSWLVYFVGEKYFAKKVWDSCNQAMVKRKTKNCFHSVKNEYLPFMATYKFDGNTVTYSRTIGETTKKQYKKRCNGHFAW